MSVQHRNRIITCVRSRQYTTTINHTDKLGIFRITNRPRVQKCSFAVLYQSEMVSREARLDHTRSIFKRFSLHPSECVCFSRLGLLFLPLALAFKQDSCIVELSLLAMFLLRVLGPQILLSTSSSKCL